MIRSIKKVKVTEVSEILPLTEDNAKAVRHQYGVYLIFTQVGNKPLSRYIERNYCKIGVASGDSVAGRLKRNMKERGEWDAGCKPLEEHYFQVLACDDRSEAARLEYLFHAWHGEYPNIGIEGKRSQPAEPRGIPLADKEPDFYDLVSEAEAEPIEYERIAFVPSRMCEQIHDTQCPTCYELIDVHEEKIERDGKPYLKVIHKCPLGDWECDGHSFNVFHPKGR